MIVSLSDAVCILSNRLDKCSIGNQRPVLLRMFIDDRTNEWQFWADYSVQKSRKKIGRIQNAKPDSENVLATYLCNTPLGEEFRKSLEDGLDNLSLSNDDSANTATTANNSKIPLDDDDIPF